MDEIPRTYEPDFRTLPYFPGDSKPTFETLPYPSEGYPSIPQGPSVEQELGKLAGMFLGQFIKNRFGK